MSESIIMNGVTEENEGYDVVIQRSDTTGRIVVRADNEGGHNGVLIDLESLCKWLNLNETTLMNLLRNQPPLKE